MASAIDATLPADGIPASKSAMRANLLTAKTEIGALQASLGATLTPVEAFGAVNDPTVDNKTAFEASFAALGYAYMPPNRAYGMSTLEVPKFGMLLGASKYSTGLVGLDALNPVVILQGQVSLPGGSIIRGFSISGVGTRALELYESPGSHISELEIGAYNGSSFHALAGHFGAFDDGIYAESMFSSTIEKVTTFNATFQNACLWLGADNHSTIVSHVQTSNTCAVNILVDNRRTSPGSIGFGSQGLVMSAVACQGGRVGLDWQHGDFGVVQGLYTEGAVLPLRVGLGNNAALDGVYGCTFQGLNLLGPNTLHPNYGDRTAHIELGYAENCTFDGIHFGSYPDLGGVYYSEARASKLRGIRSAGIGIAEKHFSIRRTSDASSLSSLKIESTDNAGRALDVVYGGGIHQYWRLDYDASGVTTTPFIPDYATQPHTSNDPMLVHLDALAVTLGQFVRINATPTNGENVYKCVAAGTTGTGTPPTGTGTGVVDGTVTWDFHGTVI